MQNKMKNNEQFYDDKHHLMSFLVWHTVVIVNTIEDFSERDVIKESRGKACV